MRHFRIETVDLADLGQSIVPKVVDANKKYAKSLKWGGHVSAIGRDLLSNPGGERFTTVTGSETEHPDAFANAVMNFQKANDLKADGVLGPNTWKKFLKKFSGIYTDDQRKMFARALGGETPAQRPAAAPAVASKEVPPVEPPPMAKASVSPVLLIVGGLAVVGGAIAIFVKSRR